jgi:hypothetical protein
MRVLEDTLEGAEMIQEQQVIEELGVLRRTRLTGTVGRMVVSGRRGRFLENPNLAGWAGHEERLAYYRGHRDGRRAREMLADGEQTA